MSTFSGLSAALSWLYAQRRGMDDRTINLTQRLCDVEDIDLQKTLTDLQLQQTAYQAALAAGARVVQPSLMDFLR